MEELGDQHFVSVLVENCTALFMFIFTITILGGSG